jgi:acyl-CoA reductase-like NAD-dependent aldehyde dehydrogenase
MLHIPLLRRGTPYRSLDTAPLIHHQTGETIAEISQANVGLIRRDLLDQAAARATLAAMSTATLVERTQAASEIFATGTLPIGDAMQGPDDYVAQVSATTGMPFVMVRRHLGRVAAVMRNVETIVRGLTRGVDFGVLDRGFGDQDGQMVSFFPRAQALGVVLPSNSPGVHGLWVPAIALKMPLVLRPGAAEPWTPYRIVQAFIAAGLPPEAFSYLPSGHAGAGEIVRQCGRSMFFGDVGAVGAFAGDPRIELHGPGYSKIVFGDDEVEQWPAHVALVAASIAENGGRSCVNASGVWTPAHGREIADALAAALGEVVPRAADDPRASLAPFVDASVAERISRQIDEALEVPGAEDVSASLRRGPRLVRDGRRAYLLPTIVHCADAGHPLANREFLFPFAAVVDAPVAAMPACLGPTLVVTALTRDRALVDRLLASDVIGRLNLGPIQTNAIAWDQPHEGNLFDHLYGRRAFQQAVKAS